MRHASIPKVYQVKTALESFLESWSQPAPKLIPTGIIALDEWLGGGLMPDSLAVVVAGTGRGKTPLVIQIASHWIAQGHGVLFIETELTQAETLARFLGPHLNVPWLDVLLKKAHIRDSDIQQVAESALGTLAIHNWRAGQDITSIIDSCPDSLGPNPHIIIDHMGDLARSNVEGSDFRAPTARIVGTLKALATERRQKILLVVQTPRYVTNDQGKPGKSRKGRDYEAAAKDAGEIEFDTAELFYLESDPCPPGGLATAKIHVAKARGAPPNGVIPVRFDAAVGRFLSDEQAAQESTADTQRVLDALAHGKPVGVKILMSRLGMGHSRAKKCLDDLVRAGTIHHDPATGYRAASVPSHP